MAGRIVKMRLLDFMTYTNGIFYPENGLNIIIGPNGTGKSTLVCAMVLGLTSKPKTLGRASNLGAYVRTGCQTATIEIHLASDQIGVNHIIKRVINRDGSSSWYLNGSSSTSKAVEKLVAQLKIQVDNLCQFLPQERVQDFARMNAQALLENTIKCTGTEEMNHNFERLKELRKSELDLEKEINVLTEQLDGLEQQNSRREVHVENMKQKRAMRQKIQHLKQKLAWWKYDVIRTELTQVKTMKKNALESLKTYQKQIEPLRKKQAAAIKDQENVQKSVSQIEREVKTRISNARQSSEQAEQLVQKIQDEKQSLETKLQAENQRKQEVDQLQTSLKVLEQNLLTAMEEAEVDPAAIMAVKNDIQKKVTEIKQLNNKKVEIQSEIESVSQKIEGAEHEINIVKNVANQRLQLLQRQNPDAYKAVLWLRENKNRFRATIHEPMKLLINVKSVANAKYIESVVAERDLIAFACENKDDMNEFLMIAQESNWKINVVDAPSSVDLTSPYSLDQIKQFGFWTFISDLFTAPQAIVNYLCKAYRIFMIPVGTKKTEQLSDKIPPEISTYFTDKFRFNVKKSKYSGEILTRTMEIKPARSLHLNIDTARLQRAQQNLDNFTQEKAELDNRVSQIQEEIEGCRGEIEELRVQHTGLLKKQDAVNQLKMKIKVRQNQINRLNEQALDVDAAKAASRRNIVNIIERLVTCEKNAAENLEKAHNPFMEKLVTKIQLSVSRKQISMLENKSRDLQSKEKELLARVEEINGMLQNVKAKAHETLDAAKALTNNIIPNQPAFEPYKKIFDKLPDTVDDLEATIQTLQSKIDCIGDTDEGLVRLFENTKLEIKSLNKMIDNKKATLEGAKQEMAQLKNTWLPAVRELISQINTTYSKCFSILGSAGEVDLSFGKSEDDFEEYGLRIRVKFRMNENMNELSRFLQSGGERAVATAVFMISLQELTKVPFCCVDEINQGMDQQNEHMICDLLVATTSRPDSAQYFLLTPKKPPSPLLKDVGATTIVFNGYQGLKPVYKSYLQNFCPEKINL